MRHLEPLTLRRFASIALAATLVLTVVAHLFLAAREFGPLRGRAIQVDELYFAACAARGTATGTTMAGCHDNKAPLIHLLYQAVQAGDLPYDIVAVKVAAYGTVSVIVALVALLAYRFAGPVGALLAGCLLLQAMSSDASVMAFKTDTVGTAFVLLALLLLTRPPARAWTWWWSGVLLGLAVVTKQTFALVAVAVVGWMATSAVRATAPGIGAFVQRAGLFLLGAAAPFAAFLLAFGADGRQTDYLASFFLYPSVYGGQHSGLSLREFMWRLAQVLDTISDTTLLTILFVIAAMLSLNRDYRHSEAGRPRLLVLFSALVLLVVLVVSPFHFTYHTVPVWALMAILAGTVIGDPWPRLRDTAPHIAACVAGVLLVATLLSAAGAWRSNGGRGAVGADQEPTAAIGGGGRYAYVLGTWPDFYVYNRLVPASDVMFPWALPGMPANWSFTPPPGDSWRGQALARMQTRNVDKLFDDFRRTPPGYIVVLDGMAHRPGSTQVSDVPGFDAYLQSRCVPERTLIDPRRGIARVFRCNL